MTDAHVRYMRGALELAERGWGRVHPNPLVGAVVVRDGVVVGEGCHREFGGAHAEIEALAAAGSNARDATLYVTLEPCSHHGKTPPCTEAIVRAGIATVVFGATDPHPEARGGADVLRRAGINVVGGIAASEVRHQNAIFFHSVEKATPFVAIKVGMSLDARIARALGQRTRITSDEANREVHRLRSGFDAIMIGSNTVRIDDPLLTVRGVPAPIRPPIRIVLDSRATVTPEAALVRTIEAAPVWIVVGEDAPKDRVKSLEAAGVRVLQLATTERGIAVLPLLDELRENHVSSTLCEGGSTLAGSLLDEDVVERLYAFIAPRLLGPGGVPAFGLTSPLESPGWRTSRIAQLGNDALLMLDRERED